MTNKKLKGVFNEEVGDIVPIEEYEKHDFDIDEEIPDDNKIDNPFIELRNLISSKEIDVKTVLNSTQIVRLQKLNILEDLIDEGQDNMSNDNNTKRRKNLEKIKGLLKNYQNNYMKLVINREGLSRKQFIEALHKGSDKAEESKNQKLAEIMRI